jgi:hypothetical protein
MSSEDVSSYIQLPVELSLGATQGKFRIVNTICPSLFALGIIDGFGSRRRACAGRVAILG